MRTAPGLKLAFIPDKKTEFIPQYPAADKLAVYENYMLKKKTTF